MGSWESEGQKPRVKRTWKFHGQDYSGQLHHEVLEVSTVLCNFCVCLGVSVCVGGCVHVCLSVCVSLPVLPSLPPHLLPSLPFSLSRSVSMYNPAAIIIVSFPDVHVPQNA